MATATATPKRTPASLTMEIRGNQRVYKLPKRMRDKFREVADECGRLSDVADLNPEAVEANNSLANLLKRFEA